MAETETQVRLPDPSKLVVSSSPHFSCSDSKLSGIMLSVIIALVPACLASVWFFGLRSLLVICTCTLACVAGEWVCAKWIGRKLRLHDCSALVTGVLLGLNLSAGTPLWVCVIGSLFAIIFGKMIYGGLGYNPFNPALVGRVALLVGFPSALTTWVRPLGIGSWAQVTDTTTTATPLSLLANGWGISPDAMASATAGNGSVMAQAGSGVMLCGEQGIDYLDLFLGNVGGCLGETSALALLLGGLFLIWKKIIRWEIPVAFIGTVFIISGLAHLSNPVQYAPPIFHILSGGLFLGAFFMATDMVTSPMNGRGSLIFGFGCGLITCIIRLWGSYPEGVSFSILLMNAMVPFIERWTNTKPFGYVKH